MKVGGHGLRDHIRLVSPLLALIAAVWALRLVLHLAGAPPLVLHITSVTLATAAATLLAGIMVHNRQFGSYANVVVAVFILSVWEQILISAAIAFTALTGLVNVYSAPEFSFGQSLWVHIAGHLIFGIGSGTLFGTVVGGVVFWMLRKADRMQGRRAMSGR